MTTQNDFQPHKQLVIGLVMDFFNPKLLEGAKTYTKAHGLRLDARWSVRGDWIPDQLNWDGVLYGLVDHVATSQQIKNSKLPSIALVADDPGYSVIPDYCTCGQMAVNELVRYGVRHILTLKLSPRFLDQAFMVAVISSCQQHDISHSKADFQSIVFRKRIPVITSEILTLPKPLGLCLPHAAIAHSITNALLQAGLRVPEDVSIVVIDKDPQQTSDLAPIPLTGVELNEWHRGFVATETLHQLLLGKKPKRQQTKIRPRGIHGRASTGHSETHDPIMAKALSFLRAHYLEEIGVPEIVAASGASRRTLEMRFREMLSSSIHEELRRLRIDEAKHHLEQKMLSITEVASTCGFSTVHYFSGAFKREMGISPKKFQESIQ